MKQALGIFIMVFAVAIGVGFWIYYSKSPQSTSESSVSQNNLKPKTITVGSISFTLKEEVETFQPFMDYLAQKLTEKEGHPYVGRVMVATSMDGMIDLLKKGKVDLYIDSPFPVLYVSKYSGSVPFLRRWKKGRDQYHSVVFVRKDSGLKTVQDLKGHVLAFDEPFSTSGYLLPKAVLLKEGLILKKVSNTKEVVSPDEIGFVFSNDDENTMFWVLKKKVDAGVMDDAHFKRYAGVKIDELKVVGRSVNVPRHVVAYRKNISLDLVREIENILVEMDQSEMGKKVLYDFQKTSKIDRFPLGVEKSLDPVRNMMQFIEGEINKNKMEK